MINNDYDNNRNEFYKSIPIESYNAFDINDIEKFNNNRKKKYHIIINPHSGKGAAIKTCHKIHKILDKCDIEYDISETKYSGHAYDLGVKHNIYKYEGVIFIGGDGIINEYMNGLLSKDKAEYLIDFTPISIISCGTQNGIAKGIGTSNIYTSLYCIIKMKMRKLDVMQINVGDGSIYYSFSGVAYGVGSDMVLDYEEARILGMLRYPYLKAKWGFFDSRPHKARLYYVYIIFIYSYHQMKKI